MTTAEAAFVETQYVDELGIRVNPCIEIIALTDAKLSDGPHAGLLNFYEAFRRRFGEQIKWYRTNTDDHFKKIKPGKLDMVPFWFEDPRNKKEYPILPRKVVTFKLGKELKDFSVVPDGAAARDGAAAPVAEQPSLFGDEASATLPRG